MKSVWSTVGPKFLAMENALPKAQQQTRTLAAFAKAIFTQSSHRHDIHGYASELKQSVTGVNIDPIMINGWKGAPDFKLNHVLYVVELFSLLDRSTVNMARFAEIYS